MHLRVKAFQFFFHKSNHVSTRGYYCDYNHRKKGKTELLRWALLRAFAAYQHVLFAALRFSVTGKTRRGAATVGSDTRAPTPGHPKPAWPTLHSPSTPSIRTPRAAGARPRPGPRLPRTTTSEYPSPCRPTPPGAPGQGRRPSRPLPPAPRATGRSRKFTW